jgi:hypothetical protein
VPAGIYRHFKGRRYLVLGLARDDADDEPVVVYVRLYERSGPAMNVRRLDDFLQEVVDAQGRRVPRFQFIGQREDER